MSKKSRSQKSFPKRFVQKILLPVGKVLFWLLRREPSRILFTAITVALLVSAVTALAVVLTNPDALTPGAVLSADNWNRVVNKVLQIGDVGTSGKMCTSDGTKINCASDAPTSGGGNAIDLETGLLKGFCVLSADFGGANIAVAVKKIGSNYFFKSHYYTNTYSSVNPWTQLAYRAYVCGLGENESCWFGMQAPVQVEVLENMPTMFRAFTTNNYNELVYSCKGMVAN